MQSFSSSAPLLALAASHRVSRLCLFPVRRLCAQTAGETAGRHMGDSLVVAILAGGIALYLNTDSGKKAIGKGGPPPWSCRWHRSRSVSFMPRCG